MHLPCLALFTPNKFIIFATYVLFSSHLYVAYLLVLLLLLTLIVIHLSMDLQQHSLLISTKRVREKAILCNSLDSL
jgi:glycine betaine/choline ABC-type transport system substrate-binding protein